MPFHYNRIGIEFECGLYEEDFDNFIKPKLKKLDAKDIELNIDGSVKVERPEEYDENDLNWWSNGEITFNIEVKNLKKALKILHSFCRQNSSCGNHIHISLKGEFTREFAYIITHKKSFQYFIDKYKERFKDKYRYMERLNNGYCSFNLNENLFKTQLESPYKDRSRYHCINLNPVRHIGTLEIRALPYMNDADEHWEAIRWVLKTLFEIYQKFRIVKRKEIKLELNNNSPQKRRVECLAKENNKIVIKKEEICVIHQ